MSTNTSFTGENSQWNLIGARFYDSSIGIFTSTDPMEEFWNSFSFGIKPHTLRHACASHMLKNEKEIRDEKFVPYF